MHCVVIAAIADEHHPALIEIFSSTIPSTTISGDRGLLGPAFVTFMSFLTGTFALLFSPEFPGIYSLQLKAYSVMTLLLLNMVLDLTLSDNIILIVFCCIRSFVAWMQIFNTNKNTKFSCNETLMLTNRMKFIQNVLGPIETWKYMFYEDVFIALISMQTPVNQLHIKRTAHPCSDIYDLICISNSQMPTQRKETNRNHKEQYH
ncbi:hypothetical protein FF38_00306 [Lucilia cuprina]|uniref:Uncharacterized protein n=1 Tax=Lucilia cuprina TaxID=7375 RepID=A0A0L0BLH4_LUCCU|nr:hypothetical protein FF38_00306 [Lucilia cuprina]